METIQLTIDESLLAEMNRATDALQMTPSDFMRVALERALQQREIIAMERKHAQGMHATHKLPMKLASGKVSKSGANRETR